MFSHWPMETSLSPAALYHVESAIRFYLSHRMGRATVSNTQTCLGCGSEYVGDCEACYERLKRCLSVFSHWPMETSATPAALYHVEAAIRFYLSHRMERDGMTERPEVRAELANLANIIRAYLQHVAAGMPPFRDEPTDEELLS